MRPLLVLGATLLLALPAAAASGPRVGLVLLAVDPPAGANGEPQGPVRFWAVAPHDGAVAHDLGLAAGSWDEFRDAAFSPDGQSILDLHTLGGASTALSSLDSIGLATGRRTVLLRRPGISQFAVSPDGRHVAFAAYDRARTGFSLYVSPLPRGPVRTLVRRFDEPLLTWAGDGLLYTLCDGDVVCSLDPATGVEQPLPLPTALLADEEGGRFAFSPDASRIAAYVTRGPAGVRIFGRDGGVERNVQGRFCVGAFAPDGSRLLLSDWCSGARLKLYVFDFRSRQLRRLHVSIPIAAGATDAVLDWQPRYP